MADAPPSTLYTRIIANGPHLERTLRLRGAVSLNLLDMIGVGPFITLPLLLGSMGGPQAMLGWILGALLAVCDGLVWAELGAALPEAGGTFHFLRRIFPGTLGQYLSFLFLFQLLFSAPLSIASGAIGLSHYAEWWAPSMAHPGFNRVMHLGHYSAALSFGPATLIAIGAIVVAVFLLFRQLGQVQRISIFLAVLVLGTIALVIFSALLSPEAHFSRATTLPPGAFRLTPAFFSGLASAMLVATYDYWGYYNVAFLGAEVKDPGRTVPRAILCSIAICVVLYLALTMSVLSVLPWQQIAPMHGIEARRATISVFTSVAWSPIVGRVAAQHLAGVAALLVMLTAFASIFSLLLGYSRIPYAAAREGAFFPIFARLHPTRRVPTPSLFTLAAVAAICCFFTLAEVIAALVVVRILLQFLLQHAGVIFLRRTQPGLERPFRLWLYPLPPLVAIVGFGYILFARANFLRELLFAAALLVAGSLAFLASRRWGRQSINPGETSNTR